MYWLFSSQLCNVRLCVFLLCIFSFRILRVCARKNRAQLRNFCRPKRRRREATQLGAHARALNNLRASRAAYYAKCARVDASPSRKNSCRARRPSARRPAIYIDKVGVYPRVRNVEANACLFDRADIQVARFAARLDRFRFVAGNGGGWRRRAFRLPVCLAVGFDRLQVAKLPSAFFALC